MTIMDPHNPMFGWLALAALLVGLLLWIIGLGMLFVQSFKTGFWWGVGSLVLMPVLYIFVGMYWKRARMGFLLHLLGLGLMTAGGYMAWLMGVDLTPLKHYTI
jgi:hypothetical protein